MDEILTNYFQPLSFLCEWRKLLADPIGHWKDGKSAKELAKFWNQLDGIPESLRNLFPYDEIKPIFLFPEYPVPMPGKGYDSSSDLYVLTSTRDGYMPIIVEAKAGEGFGSLISDWYVERLKSKDKGTNGVTSVMSSLTRRMG